MQGFFYIEMSNMWLFVPLLSNAFIAFPLSNNSQNSLPRSRTLTSNNATAFVAVGVRSSSTNIVLDFVVGVAFFAPFA